MECIFTTKMMLNDENGLNQWYIEGVVGFRGGMHLILMLGS